MRLLFTLLALACSGCVTHGKFYIEASPRYATLEEDFFASQSNIDIGIPNYSYEVFESGLKGTGGQFSFIDVSDYWYSRLGYHFVNFESDTFSYSIDNSPATPVSRELTAHGFEADIGLRLWHFIPFITAKYSKMEFKGHSEMDILFPEDNIFLSGFISSIGAGLAVDIPLSKRFNLFLRGSFMENSQTYSVGLLMGGWDYGDPTKAKRDSRKK